MVFVGKLLILAIDIYIFIIIAQVILQWLIRFDVITIQNPHVANAIMQINRFVDPVYQFMRRYLPIPPIGGIDISPIVLILVLHILQSIIGAVLIY